MDFILNLLKEIALFYNEVAFYLLIGFGVAGILHILFPESIIKRHLGSNSFGSVIKSTLFGIPLPICSCGVVPVAVSIKNNGASKGSVVSFLIATPQVGADSFMITYSLLGWVFGVFRIITSLITALAAGIFVNMLGNGQRRDLLPMQTANNQERAGDRARSILHYMEYELLGSIANPLLVGILIAGLVTVFVPDGFFESYMGSDFLSMLLMLVIGIPMYVCASASTPIAASLIMKGMSPGAALVFLLTGPATNAISISAILNVIGKKSTIVYLAVIAIVSLALGYLLNLFVATFGFNQIIILDHMEMLPSWLKTTGSVVLGFMLVWFYVDKKLLTPIRLKGEDMSQKVTLNVSGMTCSHCSNSVRKAIEGIDGTTDVTVDLEGKKATFVITEEAQIEAVKAAITAEGYTVSA